MSKRWRNWVIDLSALALLSSCARAPVRPTGPKGVPVIGVVIVQGAHQVSLSSNGPYRVVIGRRSSVFRRDTRTVVSLKGGELAVRLGGNRSVKHPALPVLLIPREGRLAAVDGKPYRGQLRVEPGPGGLRVVNVVNLEDYLKGVLPCELGPVSLPILEAAKAQAIAARSYALSHAKGLWGDSYHHEATQADQVYGGVGAESELATRAVEETRGLVATYRGEPIEAKYSSTCGGWTSSVEDCWGTEPLPYLTSVYDGRQGIFTRGEPFCQGSPHFKWLVRWKWSDFFRRVRENLPPLLGKPLDSIGKVVSVKVKGRDGSKRVKVVEVKTTNGTYLFTKGDIRKVLRTPRGMLKSRAFRLHLRGDEVVAEGGGYGHGAGMCQWGAMGMAKRGYNFREILNHYYRGAEIRRLY